MVLAALMLLAQGLGLWHRVAHVPGAPAPIVGSVASVALAAPAVPADDLEGPSADGWFGHAAGAHGGVDCLWFDHLACGDGAPQAAAVLATEPLPERAAPAAPAREPGAARTAAFQARAPPAGRQHA